jgi:hypothetical protein
VFGSPRFFSSTSRPKPFLGPNLLLHGVVREWPIRDANHSSLSMVKGKERLELSLH